MLTSLVGSYPQPDWLIDREKLRGRLPPRVRASDLWRIDPAYLRDAQDAAALVAIRDQERAGLDIITDGEVRRESYSNYFVMALEGVDVDNPGSVLDRNGNPMPAPRVAGADPPPRAGAGARRRVPARAHRPADQGHGPRAVHDGRAGRRPVLRRPARGGVRVRRRGPRGGPRAVRRRRRHRAARRAVDGVARRRRARVRDRDAAARAGRRARHDGPAHLLRLSAVRARAQARVPLPGGARRRARRSDLDRDRAGGARRVRARASSRARRSCSA